MSSAVSDRFVATILFYSSDKQVLLQDRVGISKCGEEWGFFGGAIETGESPMQAIVREIREELSFNLTDFEFFRMFSGVLPNGQKVTAHVFLAPLPSMRLFDQKEGRAMKLFSFAQAARLGILDMDKKILADAAFFLNLK